MNITRRNFLTGAIAATAIPSFGGVLGGKYDIIRNRLDEMEKCRRDIIHFAERYVFKEADINLRDWQKKYLRHLASGKNAFLNGYRRSGKTLMNSVFATWKFVFDTNPSKITFVSADNVRKNEVRWSIRNMLGNLPKWMYENNRTCLNTIIFTTDVSMKALYLPSLSNDVIIHDDSSTLCKDELELPFKFMYVISGTATGTNEAFGRYCEYARKCISSGDESNVSFFQITYDGSGDIYPSYLTENC